MNKDRLEVRKPTLKEWLEFAVDGAPLPTHIDFNIFDEIRTPVEPRAHDLAMSLMARKLGESDET